MEVNGVAIHPDREKDYLGHYLIKIIIDFGDQKRSFSSEREFQGPQRPCNALCSVKEVPRVCQLHITSSSQQRLEASV